MTDKNLARRVAAGLAMTFLTGAALASSVATPASAASRHGTPGPLVTFADDTGTFTISAPQNWTVYTNPQPYWGFYEVVPRNSTYATISGFSGSEGDGSSFTVQAFPLSPTADVIESFYGDYGVDCDPSTFSESAFGTGGGTLVGRRWDWYGCHDYARHTVVADYGTNYTVAADFFSDSPADSALFEMILSSLTLTSATAPMIPEGPPPTAPITFPWGDFQAVPRLGAEGVRGTGCGSAGQVGDVVPDGWWAGFTSWPGDGNLGINLVCVFSGTAAQQVLDDADDNIIDANPDFLVVDNSTRVRTMPVSNAIFTAYNGAMAGGDVCVPSTAADVTAAQPTMAWVHITNGSVDYAFYDCPRAVTPVPEPSNLPPAYPAGDPFAVWPYGEFWNVPQLGSEPVRGSGCGSEGDIGGTIPDGLWAGYVSLDGATDQLWVDLLCIFYGDSAQAVLADGGANVVLNDPGYLIVNNNDQRRAVPNNLQTILMSATDDSARCVPDGATLPSPNATHITAPVYEIDTFGANQVWIRIEDGAATWMIYGCDTGYQAGG